MYTERMLLYFLFLPSYVFLFAFKCFFSNTEGLRIFEIIFTGREAGG